jgi:hypothetical protein
MTGIRAELRVEDPAPCPVAAASRDAGDVESVSRTAATDGRVVEEFVADGEVDADDCEELFACGDRAVYRVSRDAGVECVCERLGSHDCPVRDVRAADGSLVVAVHARDVDAVREMVADLRDRFEGVSVRRLVQSDDGSAGVSDPVVVDRATLTARQREVLQTAHRMGYFARPRGANATAVAAALGVSVATFAEHLAAAQSKVIDSVLGP